MNSPPKPCPGLPGDPVRPCGKARKPWNGYCPECLRRYQRRNYRKKRAEAGEEVYGIDEKLADAGLDRLRNPDRPRAWDPEYQEDLRRRNLEEAARTGSRVEVEEDLSFLIEPKTDPSLAEEPIPIPEEVSLEEWNRQHAPSTILSYDIHNNPPEDEDDETGSQYLPTEKWVDGNYQPHRLGPPGQASSVSE